MFWYVRAAIVDVEKQ